MKLLNVLKAAVVSALLMQACGAGAAEVKLRLAGQHPVDHNATIVLKETIARIESAGVGIKIQLSPVGQPRLGEVVFDDVAQGVIDIGHNTWNKLTPEQQKVLSDAFSDASAKSFALSRTVDAQYLERLPEKGIEVVPLSDEKVAGLAQHTFAKTSGLRSKRSWARTCSTGSSPTFDALASTGAGECA